MTTPVTNAVAVKAAILALIGGLPLGEVQVGYGPPANPERDFIHLGRLTAPLAPATFRAGGRVPRIEDLTIPVHLVATVPGGSSVEVQAAEERVVGMLGEIIAAVCADPKLGGLAGLLAILPTRWEMDSGADDDASSALATLWLDAKSHLT